MKAEDADLKQWLRAILPDDLSQQAVADELGVTRKTISNLLSPNAGFGNGLTMLRYLRLAGVVGEAPTSSSRLSALEAAVADLPTRQELREALETLRAAIDSLASRGIGESRRRRASGR